MCYDLLIQSYSGLMSLTGEPDGRPLGVGFSLVDLFTGMMAYGAIVTALYHRHQTGQGQWLEASLLEGQVATMNYHTTGYFATGVEPHRMGSGHPSLVPYQTFPAADGFFIVGCANQGLWERLYRRGAPPPRPRTAPAQLAPEADGNLAQHPASTAPPGPAQPGSPSGTRLQPQQIVALRQKGVLGQQ
jgi:crotonobetainyl-CoA:carnitine CoA-transferase CaiB-like acyl-CoA transferase